MILELIKAAALLLALSLLQSFVARFFRHNDVAAQIASGVLFGVICIIGMVLPIDVGSGVIFDPRSVVLSMAGLFGGPIVAAISAAIAGGYRLWIGGGGAPVGISVIVLSVALGLAYRYLRQQGWVRVGAGQLLAFGFIVHILVVGIFTRLPVEIVERVMSTVALPFIVTFAPATLLLGLLLEDIERRMKVESALMASEAKLSLHLENTPLAAITWDEHFRCTQWNKAAQEMFGYTAEEAIGQHAMELLVPAQIEDEINGVFTALMIRDHGFRHINENKTKDGRIITCEWYNTPLVDDAGKTIGVVALGEDITARRQSEELIWMQANFDPLTGLANRQMLHHRLQQEIRHANRENEGIALLYLDLDQFKEVNDTLGHATGDQLLIEVSKRLLRDVREVDTVARLGGDEFTILIGGLADLNSIDRVADSILQQLSEPFQLGDDTAYISTSIGITLYPQDADNADAMIKNADQAMYAAKKRGRNCFEYFTASMQLESLARMSTIKDLRAALPGDQFVLYYQPIVELKSGAIQKAEALIRWRHPTKGLVSPGEFIRIAEETRLIVGIGDWVFRQAASQSARWRAEREAAFQITINTSPVQYQSEGFDMGGWLGHLRDLGLPGNAVSVEITEGMLMETDSVITKKLLAFRDAGIQVSLDDFGTGYSSLSYLKRFDIDFLKIDRAFVQNLAPGNDDLALCEAIIVMAHKLGLQVVAEGIESEFQRDLLIDAGCDYGQGFFYSEPMPAEDFEQRFFAIAAK